MKPHGEIIPKLSVLLLDYQDRESAIMLLRSNN
jgi:hypothetical protein